jgi:hypothetical protein
LSKPLRLFLFVARDGKGTGELLSRGEQGGRCCGPATAEASGASSPAARARTSAPSIVETTRPAKFSASTSATPSSRRAAAIGASQLSKAAVAAVVPGTVVFAAGALVLRAAGAEPDYLGLWLPGAVLTGIGIGLAFPTLGSAAVRDVAIDRFATASAASAVNAAFRQVGAVLGTAILIAIVAEPADLTEALHVSDSAYLFAVLASLASGAAALGLRRQRVEGGAGVGEADAETVVAGADLDPAAAHLAEEGRA